MSRCICGKHVNEFAPLQPEKAERRTVMRGSELTCSCGQHFETKSDLQDHQRTCQGAKQQMGGSQGQGSGQNQGQSQGQQRRGQSQGSGQGQNRQQQSGNKTRTAGGGGGEGADEDSGV